MTDYSNWKVLRSVINYQGNDEQKLIEAQQARQEYCMVNSWCSENPEYWIAETELYYEVQPVPAPIPPTYEEVRQIRAQYRRTNIDDQTAERVRKMANGTWTAEDEASYLALDAEVTHYIEEHFPYPVEE